MARVAPSTDTAAAAVVKRAASGIGPVVWGSDPAKGRCITLEAAGPGALPAVFRQEGQAVFRWATTALAPIAQEACHRAGVDPADLGGVVTHQANVHIIEAPARKIGTTRAVIATDVTESGNTSAAGIPPALSKLVERGAGLTYAGQSSAARKTRGSHPIQ